MAEPGWEFVLDPPDDGGVVADFWTSMAERLEAVTREVWRRDRRCIRSWIAGSPTTSLVALAGRPIVDVTRTL